LMLLVWDELELGTTNFMFFLFLDQI